MSGWGVAPLKGVQFVPTLLLHGQCMFMSFVAMLQEKNVTVFWTLYFEHDKKNKTFYLMFFISTMEEKIHISFHVLEKAYYIYYIVITEYSISL